MRSLLACFAFGGISAFAQPVIGGAGYSPTAIPVAPGQIITLFVQAANSDITGEVRASGSLPNGTRRHGERRAKERRRRPERV